MLLLISALLFVLFFVFAVLAAVLGVVVGGTVYTGLALVGVAKLFIPAIIAGFLIALLPIGKKKYLRRLPVCLVLCVSIEVIALIVWTHIPVNPTASLPDDVAKVTANDTDQILTLRGDDVSGAIEAVGFGELRHEVTLPMEQLQPEESPKECVVTFYDSSEQVLEILTYYEDGRVGLQTSAEDEMSRYKLHDSDTSPSSYFARILSRLEQAEQTQETLDTYADALQQIQDSSYSEGTSVYFTLPDSLPDNVTAKVMAMQTMYGRPTNQPISTTKYFLTDAEWIPGQTYHIDLERSDLTDDYWYTELSILLTIDGSSCSVDITSAIPEALSHPDDEPS